MLTQIKASNSFCAERREQGCERRERNRKLEELANASLATPSQ